ncbi:HAD family hydrolase [Bacillus sp. FJAT-50079]|uniref:HAD family hydrolase n=1 Tax=Bacillus sp. FJAT-50079 TaxID=2833577 RepID=UPI001BC9EE52|nr:HAD family hydrolase [Bacillus sp. FJAT-50079]MBS4210160.1 HAD family phosphatase [Bacillus sp. FJAT-50079]
MTNYKALFLDIDGTILKPDHTYDLSTKDAILQVQKRGIEVFLATGRPIHEITDLAEELNIHSFIGYNGALAIYKEQTIVHEPMSAETVREFINIAQKHGHEIVLYTNEKNFFTNLDVPSVRNFIEKFQMKHNDQYHDEIADQILGATLIHLNDGDSRLYEGDPSYHFAQVNVDGLRDCYDVIRDTVNKGEAIQKIIGHIPIPIAATIAFGDGMNDKEMLSTVGEGFVMGNGHPDLFAYGNRKTTAVTDSGIFNGLQSIGLVD